MGGHWGSTHSPRDPRQNLPTSPSTDWKAPPNTLPLPQPPRGCASPSESTAAKHVAQGDTTLSPPPVPALATARNQVPKTTRRLSHIHPHFPPRQAPALARLPGATELPPGTTGQRKLCRSHVALGVFLHQTPPEPLRRVPSQRRCPFGMDKPRVPGVPRAGQRVLTDAAHPAHQAGAEPPLLPGEMPPLHRPSPGMASAGSWQSGGTWARVFRGSGSTWAGHTSRSPTSTPAGVDG